MTQAAVAEQNPVEVPLYTPLDVARHLRAPLWLVEAMWRGWFPPHPEMFLHFIERRLIHIDRDGDLPDVPDFRHRWSFRKFADFYVRLFAVESVLELARSEPKKAGRDEVFTSAAWRVLGNHAPPPVVFDDGAPVEGIARVLQSCCGRLTPEERAWLEKRMALCLGRFDLDGSAPCRLYPFSRCPVEGSPRIIVMDPRIRFGRPTLVERGTPTDILLERHLAGDSISELADDYGASLGEIEEAIRYEAMPRSLLFPFHDW